MSLMVDIVVNFVGVFKTQMFKQKRKWRTEDVGNGER